MREQVMQWIGQEVSVAFTGPNVVDGLSGFHDQRGMLIAVDGMGLMIDTEGGYTTPAVRDHETGNYIESGKWVRTVETACIPWSAVAKVSVTVKAAPVVDTGE